jgi:hypothetical protein
MKPAARKKAAEKTKTLLEAMPLQELRHARNLYPDRVFFFCYFLNPNLSLI